MAEPARPILVTGEEIEVSSESQTTIESPALTEGLIRAQGSTLEILAEVSPVSVEDISIDERGRVVIDDPAFSRAIRDREPGKEFKLNIICGAGC